MIVLAATPIGNLGDATTRLVEALSTVGVIAAEDTRVTQRLLAGLGVEHRPRLISLNDHNERERIGRCSRSRRTPTCSSSAMRGCRRSRTPATGS
ncbi:hypothetical protein GCM10025866_06430 [Naasia aerilata]|uniref:Tetrapyrrole methylase domain-containing protein n=1 Tax=Naasia aerilata TaxID=1162966 RepID=A0ABN6XIM8_9MICO|nr:hypothetical protein GCM10025866_06430 [Naasia aerilata]